ncbi:MAG: ComEC/Rec2 family competence protein [Puniceicoccales bacterium]|jgi:ComEC/Rec2-related protein|nr:ComEC/Rec2 family competence protein [Puniceicoccales bacterium]
MKNLSRENSEIRTHVAPSCLFLPVLFFIAGVRSRKILLSLVVLVSALAIVVVGGKVLAKRFRNGIFFDKIASIAIPVAVLATSALLGSLYYWYRCAPCTVGMQTKMQGYATVILEAESLVVRNRQCGTFHGCGKIKGVARKNRNSENYDQLNGERVFFSIEVSLCDKIPLVGQEFRVGGNLKFIGDSGSNWFLRHLKNSHINWHISNCCLLSLCEKVPLLAPFFGKIADKFSYSLAIGTENWPIEIGILSAMLTGAKSEMDAVSREIFNDLGIAHLFAVSGIHIGIIAATADILLRIFGVKKSFRPIPTLFFLIFYVNAIGCSPSAMRALTMVAFYYAATLLGRRPNVLSALCNSALLHVLYDPFVAFNISFLLSYSVVAGIALMGFHLKFFLSRKFLNLYGIKLAAYPPTFRFWFKIKGMLVTSVSISISAYLASLPLSIGYFGTLSLITIPVNVIVVPIATCAIIAGAITLLCGLCGLATLCPLSNWVACSFVGIFRLLSQDFYSDACCLKNLNVPFELCAAATLAILAGAHIVVSSEKDVLFFIKRKIFPPNIVE